MSNILRSLSCKGSSSILIRDQKEPSAALSLEKMTEEEEEMPLADYFEKKGLAFKLKRFLAKLGRKKKRKRPVTRMVEPAAAGRGRVAFSDRVEDVEAQVAGGGGGRGGDNSSGLYFPNVHISSYPISIGYSISRELESPWKRSQV